MAETTTTFPAGQLTPFVVPDNVFVVRADLAGGSAAQSSTGSGTFNARGGTASALLTVTPGETLQVAVGLAGTSNTSTTARTANGDTVGRGGSGSKPGGASTHVRRGTTRLIVAGGAGATGTDGSVADQKATAGGSGGGATGGTAAGFGFPGAGGGLDSTYATGDGESATDGSGSGGGGVIGGRAGRYSSVTTAAGAGGGGSGKVPAGGTMTTGGAAVGNGSAAVTVGIAPYAPTVTTPPPGATVPADVALAVGATFNGASPKDTLSARQVRLDGAFLYSGGSDGTPVTTAALSPGQHTLEARDANQHGTWGPWSTAQAITVAVAPAAASITSPAPGSTVETTPVPLVWNGTAAGYRVRRVSDDGGVIGTVVYSDTGVLPGAGGTQLLDFPVSGRGEWLQVALVDSAGLQSAWASIRVFVQRARPAVPVAAATAVATQLDQPDQLDAIDVAITNPTQSGRPAVDHCDVYAGALGALAKVNPTPVLPNSTFRWRLPPNGVDHQVLVVAVAASGATAADFATGSPLGGYGNAPYGAFPYGL